MKALLRTLRLLSLMLGLAGGAAQAADALDRAIAYAESQQTQALGAVAVAERAVAEAQADLRVVRGIEADARRARDQAAITVAAEAAQQAQALERETERNLTLARSLLDMRVKTLANLRSWTRADRRPRAVLVADSGQVRHITPGGYEPPDLPAMRAGDTVKTGPDGRARLFVSGGDGEVALGANSSYTVNKDDAAGNFVSQLDDGLMRLQLLIKKKVGKKFEVRTPTAAIAVRGTDYSASVSAAGTVVKVYSGEVAITPAAGGNDILLKAGEQLSVPVQGPWPAPQPLSPDAVELPWSVDHAPR